MSEAVKVPLPAVLKFALKVFVPEANAPFAGRTALLSEEPKPTVSVAPCTRFQFASTAFTVTLKGVAAVCADGVPVLPLAVPGAAVSPGVNN